MSEEFIKSILSELLFGSSVYESIQDKKIIDYFYSNLLLEKLLQGEPIDVSELRKLLHKKIVNFEFIKLNGEIRPSVGTTMMKYIPPVHHPKGIRPSSPKVATFYDLDKDAWRSVSKRSKEIVLKKDEKTGKPIVVVKDKSKVKVKPVVKQRESTEPIEQGQTYKYTTNRGTNTYVEIIRELPNGLYQVSSPMFKTTFAIDDARIGNKFTPKEEPNKEEKPIDVKEPKEKEVITPLEQQPKEEKPVQTQVEKPAVKNVTPIIKPAVTPVSKQNVKNVKNVRPIPKTSSEFPNKVTKPETTIILPTEVEKTKEEKEKEETKAPPIDITPNNGERPEDLSNPNQLI